MKPRTEERSGSTPDPLDHTDPGRWEELIRSLDSEAIVLVIRSSMSRQVRDHCSAEDIWQETLTHAWRDRARHEWRGQAAFRAWIFEIARNRIREAARVVATEKRGAGRGAARLSELGSTSSASTSRVLPADSQTPSRIAARGEKLEAMRNALAILPTDLAEIVRMYAVEELTMEEVAGRLGIGLSAAWRRFRKGAEMLARILPEGTGESSSEVR